MVLSIWQRLNRWRHPATTNPPKSSENEPSQSHAPVSSAKRRFILPNAYDPNREVIPTPGFARKIEELQRAHRYRTAIEEILIVLDLDPNNQEALFLAANILSMPRTQQLTSAEPLSDKYTFDQRLNPVWAICQQCERGWVPDPVHLGSISRGAELVLMNPVGQQCPNCGYTLCHECLKCIPTGLGAGVYSHDCPHGCGVKLSVPVHPTGRNNVQFGRRKERLTHIFIFREGPIQPDMGYLQAFLESRSPDVFESRPQIVAIPVGKWPEQSFNIYVMSSLIARGVTDEMIQNNETGTIIDDDGARVHVVKLYAAR